MMRFAALAALILVLGTATAVRADHRYSCEAMRGTAYEHPDERAWFWSNCVLDVYGGGVSTDVPLPPRSESTHDPAAAFAAGYTAAGGPAYYLDHILQRVIPCESTWQRYAVNHAGPYRGLMQFASATWQAVGGGDYFDAYTQGRNTARLIAMADPATQWPVCWWA